MSDWFLVLLKPAEALLAQVGQFVLKLLLVIAILIVGWVIAKLIKAVVAKLLATLRLDELASRIELDSILEKGGIKYSLSELIGVICYWVILLLNFVVMANTIGLTVAADLLNQVILYIPNIIATIFILVLGMFVATLLRNVVNTAATNAGLSQAKLLSKIVEIVIMVFAVLIGLEQLNIGAKIIELVVSITLGSLGLAFAIAFGFGARDAAEKIFADWVDALKKK